MSDAIVILGGGQAGGCCAAFLRQYGYKGPLVLLGEEPVLPYQRPPLSKAWLKGEATAESLALRPAKFYAAQNIETRLGQRAEAIDRDARRIQLSTGESLPYARLVLALGSRPRPLALEGRALQGVLELRSMADADRLKSALRPGARLVVIGGGFIGLEVAASAIALGARAAVIEREARVLARVASPPLSAFVQDHHRAKGVEIRLGAGVEALEGRGERVCGVRLTDGEFLPADIVLIGIGALPNDSLAKAAGLECHNGIVVDLAARTDDPLIHAIGDCTSRPLPIYGCRHRLESVPNAIEQAKQAAADLCHRPPPAPELPWFWSDQFELRLQMAGLPFGATQLVLRGAPDAPGFTVFHLDAAKRVLALESVSAPADFAAGRVLAAKQRQVAPALLADPALSLKELAA